MDICNHAYNIGEAYHNGTSSDNSSEKSSGKESTMLIFQFDEMRTWWFVPFCLITAVGLTGNIVTILRILLDKRLHRTSYSPICCLAVADLASLLQFTIHAALEKSCPHISHKVGKIFLAIYFAVTHSTASHVVLLWSLRYVVTTHPLWRYKINSTRVAYISIVLWICSILFGVIYYIVRFLTGLDKIYVVLGARGYLLFTPCLVILIMHFIKVKVIRQSLYRVNMHNRLVRMSRMTCIILALYMSSAISYPVTFLLEYYKVCSDEELCRKLLTVSRLLWLLNSALNPALYFLFSRFAQKRLKVIKDNCRRKSHEELHFELT